MILLLLNLLAFSILIFRQNFRSRLLADPVVIIPAFIFTYTIIPYLYHIYKFELLGLSSFKLANLPNYSQLLNSATLFYIFMSLKRFVVLKNYVRDNNSNSPLWLYLITYACAIVLAVKYPWPSFGEEFKIGHSFLAIIKYLYILLFIRNYKPKSFVKYLSVFGALIFVFLEHSRTFMFMLMFGIIYMENIKLKSVISKFPLILTSLLVLVYVTAVRTGIDFDFKTLFWVFSVETIFSTYGSIQASYWLPTFISNSDITWLTLPFYGLIGLLLDFMKIGSDSFYYNFTDVVPERISPMGGHLIFAEHLLRFGKIFLVTAYLQTYYYISKVNYNLRSSSLQVALVSISFLIAKSTMVTIAYTVIILIILNVLISRLKRNDSMAA